MPLYKGPTLIKDVYVGSSKIKEIYKGSNLIFRGNYPSGTVLFEASTPGAYNILFEHTQEYSIILVGGGGAGSGFRMQSGSGAYQFIQFYCSGGGSGALIAGTTTVAEGTYTVVVGSGGAPNYKTVGNSGTQSSFLDNIAGGGVAHISYPSGGTATVVSQGLSGANGYSGAADVTSSNHYCYGGASLYNGYGAGGAGSWDGSQAGAPGYVKIWVP